MAQASIRQREADLKLAQNNLDRSRSLYERQLLPQQTFDDVDARHQAAVAQLDLARAQFEQAKARLDELKITLTNTQIVSPVDGFVGKRYLDPGAFASTNAPVASVVDIRTRADGGQPGRARHAARAGRHGGQRRGRRVPRRNVQGTRQPRRAGLRPGHAHGGDRNRSAERRLPAEAGHVFARAADDQHAQRRDHRPAQRARRRRGQERRLRRRAGARRRKARAAVARARTSRT